MQDSQLATISNFFWNIADSVLRDLYVRGKYRDVILPMTVIRRLDAVIEPTKQQVLEEKKWLDEAGISDQTGPLQQAAGQQFFNASPFTLRDLRNAAQELNHDDVPSPIGGKWTPQQVRKIRQNGVNCGTYLYGRQNAEGQIRVENAFPAIVTWE